MFCVLQLNKVDVSGCICKEDGSSCSSIAPSANYSVSPRGLTLRLHEVIQSRLEERIQELELALENSQRKVRLMESTQKSRSGRQFFNGMARPVVMNLSGEGLSTYDEACEEFVTFDSSEDNSPSYCNNYLPRSDKPNGIEEKLGVVTGRIPLDPHETLSGAQEIDTFGMSRDESSDADDELLIRQLVERTKRGSPALMKAQRLLFSDQGDPH
ncbi:hypothetical protein MLD38_025010 [Melastoma candidum]|uniref:Uncharacterized protein n=1 Tax=Melastoma candidum TaxID=119954 RepID=A0ACB9NX43_9MYRT|nr:hypothetical protein MLD38_025010 [Melastoma candidum]